ncbi:MAG: tRNA A-37 threonylcarbamoyl transferase component Bud32 [Flavobacteriaceae bacterium]|jgi:tRNA A-37 threonylcarbamoyl transferase component Bud32
MEGITIHEFSGSEKLVEKNIYSPEERREKMCELAETFFIDEKEIGEGRTADVYFTSEHANICLKRMKKTYRSPYLNTVEEEGMYLESASKFKDTGVRVPEPIAFIEARVPKDYKGKKITIRESVLAMEQIDGISFQDIIKPAKEKFRKKMPENFNIDSFFQKLQDFIAKLNENKIYHRDLHMGNVMIDRETGDPVVIDFGFSAKQYSSDQDMYNEVDETRGKVTHFLNDKRQVEILKKEIQEYLL